MILYLFPFGMFLNSLLMNCCHIAGDTLDPFPVSSKSM